MSESESKDKGILDFVKQWVTTLHFVCLAATPVLFYMSPEWGAKFITIDLVTFMLALLFPPFGFVKPEEHFSPKNCPPPSMPKRGQDAASTTTSTTTSTGAAGEKKKEK